MSGSYERDLDPGRGVVLHVRFTTVRREVTDYAVVLSVAHQGKRQTVRVYDGAHEVNEMHRHTAAAGSNRARSSTAVALAKACAPRSRSA